MPKELFDQTLIVSPALPDNNDRFAVGQPGVPGGRNILWSYLKQLLQGAIAWLDFTPQDPVPAHLEGRMFYDDVEKAWSVYNDINGISLQIGEELRARLTNDTGGLLSNGVAVAVIGSVGANLQVELLNAANLNSSVRAIGLITHDINDTDQGYVVRYGAVRELNTIAFSEGDLIYADPATPGGWTNVRPNSPYYPVRIGVCIISHASEGVIGVDTLSFSGSDTGVNLEGTLNGVVVETPHVEFYESGGTIYVEVTNQNDPTQDLAFILDDIRYQLNTTSGPGPNNGAVAALVAGADAETLFENFIYVWLNGATPELKVSTLATSDTLAPIGKAALFNVTRTLADGHVGFWRRFNDAPDNAADDGFNRWMADIARDKLGTTYTSGIDATVVVNSTPSVTIATTAGVAMQAHKSTFQLQDGTSYTIYNNTSNAATYEEVSDLAVIVATALGVSLAVNGAYYRLKVYGVQNSDSGGALAVPDALLVTRPLGYYSSAAEALTDAANYDVQPNDIITEGILFPLYTIVIARTGGGGGGTWTEVSTLDDRSRLIGGTGGGGATGGGGLDDKVRVSATDTTNSYLDDKLTALNGLVKSITNPSANEAIELKLGGSLTGNTAIAKAGYNLTINGDGDIILTTSNGVVNLSNTTGANTSGLNLEDGEFELFLSSLVSIFADSSTLEVTAEKSVFSGQAHGGSYTKSFSASATFDANDGNFQKMVVTASTTVAITNELPGTYIIKLEIDTATSPTVTIGASLGTKLPNGSLDIDNADNAINIITVAVDPDGTKDYSIIN